MGLIVYPENNHSTSSQTIFFIGHAQKEFWVNATKVELLEAGNFCPVFDLKLGENKFQINLDGKEIDYLITRTEAVSESKSEFKDFDLDYQLSNLKKDKLTICLDPGHGGAACGTQSPKGLKEKDLNLKVALEMKKGLEALGHNIILSRNDDIDLELAQRVAISKDAKADLFLSIHHNAIPDHQNPIEHHGISAHYYHLACKDLAEDLSKQFSQKTNLRNNGAIRQSLHVVRENLHCPAILLELGYMIHPGESEILEKLDYSEIIQAIDFSATS